MGCGQILFDFYYPFVSYIITYIEAQSKETFLFIILFFIYLFKIFPSSVLLIIIAVNKFEKLNTLQREKITDSHFGYFRVYF